MFVAPYLKWGVVVCALGAWLPGALAEDFDPEMAWPLCGRIAENPPPGWQPADGCPSSRFADAGYSDEPLSSTFGPRPLYSENNRYDFHRGIDIL